MPKLTIVNKFAEICSAGKIAPLQVTPIMRIIDMRCPDDIKLIESSSLHTIALEYIAEGIVIQVEKFRVLIHDLLQDSWTIINDLDKEMPSLMDLFCERERVSQAITIRSVLNHFNCTALRVSAWCTLTIDISNHKVVAIIRPRLTDVELHSENGDLMAVTSSMDTTATQDIIDMMVFYCKTVDKTFRVPRSVTQAVKTTMFSESQPDSDKSTNNLAEAVRKDQSCEEDNHVTLGADAIPRTKQEICKGFVSVDQVYGILNNLMRSVDNSFGGSFADGWREAISAAINNINGVIQ